MSKYNTVFRDSKLESSIQIWHCDQLLYCIPIRSPNTTMGLEWWWCYEIRDPSLYQTMDIMKCNVGNKLEMKTIILSYYVAAVLKTRERANIAKKVRHLNNSIQTTNRRYSWVNRLVSFQIIKCYAFQQCCWHQNICMFWCY